MGQKLTARIIPLDVAMAFAGLTTEQLDTLCAANGTFRAALESWILEGGPYAWNEWQRGFHQLARRYSARDPEAVPPVSVAPAQWALQWWNEASEAIYGPEWRGQLRKSTGAAAEGSASRGAAGVPAGGRPSTLGAPQVGGGGSGRGALPVRGIEEAWGLQHMSARALRDVEIRSAPEFGAEEFSIGTPRATRSATPAAASEGGLGAVPNTQRTSQAVPLGVAAGGLLGGGNRPEERGRRRHLPPKASL